MRCIQRYRRYTSETPLDFPHNDFIMKNNADVTGGKLIGV
jgi:hypothetical protein